MTEGVAATETGEGEGDAGELDGDCDGDAGAGDSGGCNAAAGAVEQAATVISERAAIPVAKADGRSAPRKRSFAAARSAQSCRILSAPTVEFISGATSFNEYPSRKRSQITRLWFWHCATFPRLPSTPPT